jgi:hypothetical protein
MLNIHVVLVSKLIILKIRINSFSSIVDHHCEQGVCTPIGATSPSKELPLHNYILIGVGSLAVIGLICVIIVAIYRQQTKNTEKSFNRPSSFSQSSNVTFRSSSSAGFRTHNSTLQPSSDEATVNIETPKTINS